MNAYRVTYVRVDSPGRRQMVTHAAHINDALERAHQTLTHESGDSMYEILSIGILEA